MNPETDPGASNSQTESRTNPGEDVYSFRADGLHEQPRAILNICFQETGREGEVPLCLYY